MFVYCVQKYRALVYGIFIDSRKFFDSRKIFTDSLSTIMAASGSNYTKGPKTRKNSQLMDKRKGNLTLCWVSGHAGITGN
jgi:hypothetical protein